jgi:hypothetical protein
MARGEKASIQVRQARYRSGERVWVGQSRGSMREGTVVCYLGAGSYRVHIAGCGARTVDEGLLGLRQEDGALDGAPVEAVWRVTGTEKRSLVEQGRMRWYNPALGGFEWREVPSSDEDALSLLEGYPGSEAYAKVYTEWRVLGAAIRAALIRAGEAAKGEQKD